FEYQPLETSRTIRLLKLIPRGPAEFRLVMSHHSLDNCPPFEAMSYTWSDPTYRSMSLDSPSVSEIDCNGGRCEIPANLMQALPAIARVQKAEYLWADAVCIHQKDEDEKSVQVLLMGDIYSQASRVIIWLG
ncbi:HET-domain-containing protein, partial [Tothia fuscella]